MKKNVYYYALRRPFSIGTFPLDNFIEYLEEVEGLVSRYRWGFVTYSKPVTLEEIERFELCPIPPASFWKITLSRLFGKHEINVTLKPGVYSYVAIMEEEGEEEPISMVKLLKEMKERKWDVFNDAEAAAYLLGTYDR